MFGLAEVFENAVSTTDIVKFLSDIQHYKYNEALTSLSDSSEDPYEFRRTQVRSMTRYQSPVINQAIGCIAKYINNKPLTVHHIRSEIHLLRYSFRDGQGDFFDKHHDIYDQPYDRVVSSVVMLSDPSEYTGGDLILYHGEQEFVVPKQRGTVVCFPSRMYHQVTPITSGVRYSMIIWSGRANK